MRSVTIQMNGSDVQVTPQFENYVTNNRVAVLLVREYSRLPVSANVADADLEDDEFCLKNYSENAGWAQQFVDSYPELFENTGKFVRSGYVEMPVYKVIARESLPF